MSLKPCHFRVQLYGRTSVSYFSCSLDDIYFAREVTHRDGKYIKICTSHGNASVTEFVFKPNENNLKSLHDGLLSLGIPETGGPELEDVNFHTLIGLAAFAGGILASQTLTAGMNDFELTGRMVAGILLAIVTVILLTFFAYRQFGIRLVLCLLGAHIGAGFGAIPIMYLYIAHTTDIAFMTLLFGPHWKFALAVVGMLVCVIGCGVIGMMIQHERSRVAEEIRQSAPHKKSASKNPGEFSLD